MVSMVDYQCVVHAKVEDCLIDVASVFMVDVIAYTSMWSSV